MVVHKEMSCIQCTLVGDKRVGKSTILRGLEGADPIPQADRENNNYESTIFDNIAGEYILMIFHVILYITLV